MSRPNGYRIAVAAVLGATLVPGWAQQDEGPFSRAMGGETAPAASTAAPPSATSSLFGDAALNGEIEAAQTQAAREREAQRLAEEKRQQQLREAAAQRLAAERAAAEAEAEAKRQRTRRQQEAREQAERNADQTQPNLLDEAAKRFRAGVQTDLERMRSTQRRVERHEQQRLERERQVQREQAQQRQQAELQRRASEAGQQRPPTPTPREPGAAQAATKTAGPPTAPAISATPNGSFSQASAVKPAAAASDAAMQSSAHSTTSPPPARVLPGSSGAGVRVEAASAEPGGAGQGPGRGSMTKRGLTVGACRTEWLTVNWRLGALLGEPTVDGGYTWQGPADCELPSSTVVLLYLRRAGEPGGWVALSPAVPRAGKASFNATGSPSSSQLLCHYDNARRTDCLPAQAAARAWLEGAVTDFVVAW